MHLLSKALQPISPKKQIAKEAKNIINALVMRFKSVKEVSEWFLCFLDLIAICKRIRIFHHDILIVEMTARVI